MWKFVASLVLVILLAAQPALACDEDDDDEDGCAYHSAKRQSVVEKVERNEKVERGSEAPPRLASTPPPLLASVGATTKSAMPVCKRYSPIVGQMIVVPCSH